MELPCNAERHNCVPAPGEPGCAIVLVATAGPQSQGLQSLHGRREWAAHGGPHHRPLGRALRSVH
eukprot:1829834-Alexandrium_andersonii.AAC.1